MTDGDGDQVPASTITHTSYLSSSTGGVPSVTGVVGHVGCWVILDSGLSVGQGAVGGVC